VILLHVLPAALAASWWAQERNGRLGRFGLDLLAGVLLGAAIALAWAVPAGLAGGGAYREAIFWGQTAGRVAESFAHRAPWWYYLPFVPLVLFPWFVWPRFWKGLKTVLGEHQARFLLAWLLLTLLAFSLVSGKQPKYLVPLLPAFALLAGRAIGRGRDEGETRRWDMVPPAAGVFGAAAFLGALRARPEILRLPEWVAEVPPWPVAALALLGASLLAFSRAGALAQMRALSFATLFGMAVVGAGVVPALVPYADPAPVARYLADLQARQLPLAHLGKYHAQYHFAGRLEKPIEILDPPGLAAWVQAHPQGRVIAVERRRAAGPGGPELQAPFRGAWLQVWRGEALLAAQRLR
jgi:4-amino-4-deoxy-L-arabinose transferase-like glycosyltransferase